MYLTMNRFHVTRGQEQAFEEMWASRDSHLKEVPGFVSFHLMKGETREDHTLYASHTAWKTEAAFRDWTKSEAFRKAHSGVRPNTEMYQGAPVLEVFEAVQTLT
ncbi:Heme oxygenase (staphylobilin-producing) 1 [Rhodobacteraceae bacterium THAF1]|uniref:antibiotic biosynthesis monooxygenase family protein n=1 Tax=Palleronia sp. THAF1 TaxID=2587842 RepID=UPI000F3EE48C|nr:antibiotic biosynthesis monooxygenase [Palleronia sp. THAF1]QFU08314.1 Heme oxygenase (staphylobilin-producing) 1 [Palleronia sp. THAF1]VDC28945.1 Heme oxygenase (staphylobilin-producing) 1 [Rhodobacteraceae bacterium THAF1]